MYTYISARNTQSLTTVEIKMGEKILQKKKKTV